ncbi:XK-related protein 8 [Nannospalax galili]|uniref:XK-related protein 8 n=1 Tax=Nannospalax galili TaxID=1026970 RepID=UPI0004ED5BED|nr:XK-related protein 8 [Nannospalax galili]
MPLSPRAALLRDLVLGVVGTVAFLLDLVADLWTVGQYVLSGRYLWAALVLALLGLASVALQIFSWVWLRADHAELHGSQSSSRYLALLHLLQLGYLYRCMHGLQQGLSLWQQEAPSEFDLDYSNFLSMDISMLRLFETFLETTPQLTLVLAIVLQSGRAQYYQWVGIVTSYLGISWALLDYHRALRTCLPSKHQLGLRSSAIYFLWNLLLLGPRVLAIALFSALFPHYVPLHFLGLWLVLLLWVWLQGTDFMPDPCSEWLYRAVVATTLYFSWFNVSDGHTRGRATIHLMFILSDNVLLVTVWVTHSTWLPNGDSLQMWLIIGGGVCFFLGLALRLVYYHWLHPSCPEPDHVDGARSFLPSECSQLFPNKRATQWARNFFSKAR